MQSIKESISDGLECMAKNMAVNSISFLLWGKIEMPECLREEVEYEFEKRNKSYFSQKS